MPGRYCLRSLLLSFAMLSVTGLGCEVWAKNADDAVDQTAMAIPRIGMPGAHSVALPQPLSPGDVVRIKQIFALQRAGSVSDATQIMDHLESDVLHGAILADRYLETGYVAEVPELSAWLARFGDQPDAPAIRALLETLTQRHSDVRGLPGPKARPGQKAATDIPVRTLLEQNDDHAAVEAARSLLAGVETGPQIADSLFSGGVAAWRLSDLLAEKEHDHGTRVFWLRRAAREANTFYGPIARHALDPIGPCLVLPSPTRPVVTNADVEALMATQAGRRSFALLQVGERRRAEAELRSLWFDSGPRLA